MNQQPQETKQIGVWVRLHLEKQNEASEMPSSIVGYLSEETQGSYVLTKTMEYEEEEHTYTQVPVEKPVVLLVSRTYVWACEILGELPSSEAYNGEGGIG